MKKDRSKRTVSDTISPDMPVQKQLFRNIRRAHDSLHIEMYKLCKTHEITIAQFDLLETILISSNRALSIQQLARKTVSRQPNVTRSVGVLEKAGLVKCTKDKNDSRMVRVQLTEKGNSFITQVQKPLLNLHYAQFENFDIDELIIFNEFLKRISQSRNPKDK